MTNFAERYRNARSHEAKEEIESEAFQVARSMLAARTFELRWFPRESRYDMMLADWQYEVEHMCRLLDDAIAENPPACLLSYAEQYEQATTDADRDAVEAQVMSKALTLYRQGKMQLADWPEQRHKHSQLVGDQWHGMMLAFCQRVDAATVEGEQ